MCCRRECRHLWPQCACHPRPGCGEAEDWDYKHWQLLTRWSLPRCLDDRGEGSLQNRKVQCDDTCHAADILCCRFVGRAASGLFVSLSGLSLSVSFKTLVLYSLLAGGDSMVLPKDTSSPFGRRASGQRQHVHATANRAPHEPGGRQHPPWQQSHSLPA